MCTYLGIVSLYQIRHCCLLELCSVGTAKLFDWEIITGQEKKNNFTKEWLLTFCSLYLSGT